jgi:hypothetical protein
MNTSEYKRMIITAAIRGSGCVVEFDPNEGERGLIGSELPLDEDLKAPLLAEMKRLARLGFFIKKPNGREGYWEITSLGIQEARSIGIEIPDDWNV